MPGPAGCRGARAPGSTVRPAAYLRFALLLPEGLVPVRSARWHPLRQTLPSPDPPPPPNTRRQVAQDLPTARDAPAVLLGHSPPPRAPLRPCGATAAAVPAPPRCRLPALSSRARRSRWPRGIRATPPPLYRRLPLVEDGARPARLALLGYRPPLGPLPPPPTRSRSPAPTPPQPSTAPRPQARDERAARGSP